jgi:hypothetical protein
MTTQSDKTEARRVAEAEIRSIVADPGQHPKPMVWLAQEVLDLRSELSAALLGMAAMIMDRETVQILLELLNPLHGSLDRQTYDEKLRQDFDTPDDCEHDVIVTSRQERDLTQAVCILEARLREAPPLPSPATLEPVRRLVVACKGLRGSGAITARYPGHDRATQEWVAALSEVEALIGTQ